MVSVLLITETVTAVSLSLAAAGDEPAIISIVFIILRVAARR